MSVKSGGSDLSTLHWAAIDNDIPTMREFARIGVDINPPLIARVLYD
ncbi:MAG: hypothetical protein GDA50_00335 [Alphaproteobacteria bacterium GM202ARS2]|nr:hypothetical protein [Alphaproteobacteria bacterium GM202ARS2]